MEDVFIEIYKQQNDLIKTLLGMLMDKMKSADMLSQVLIMSRLQELYPDGSTH